MTTSFLPYDGYRDTGLRWLPSVPMHWNLKRAKLMLRELNARSDTGAETLLSVSQYVGVTPRKKREGTDEQDTRSESLIGYKIVCPGDMVVNIMLAWNGSLGVSAYAGVVSPAYCVYRFGPGAFPDYYHNLLRTEIYKGRVKVDSRGVVDSRLRLYTDNLFCIELLQPPLEEQYAIVRFIRHLDQRVNRLIQAKRQLIALLNEQKQAIIHRVITRGLDPSIPFKPSGIPWIGDIPQHWELRRLKWVLRLQRGFDLPADRRSPGIVPVYSSGGHIDNHDVALASPPGIVIGRYGSTDAVFFVTDPYWPHNTALFTTTLYDNHPRWCFYLLRSFSKGAHAGKSAVPGVDRKDLFNIVVPRPPIAEQGALAATIDNQLAEVDRSIVSITKEIDLLREYRTRLVADVVTGQLDVRDLDLPDVDDVPVNLIDELDDCDDVPDDDLVEAAV